MFVTVVVIVIILHVQMILNKYTMVVDNVAVHVGTGTSTDMEYGEIVTLRSTRTRRSTVLFCLPVRAVRPMLTGKPKLEQNKRDLVLCRIPMLTGTFNKTNQTSAFAIPGL